MDRGIMLADYPAFLEEGRSMPLSERVSRACVVPELFSWEDIKALNSELQEHGFRPSWTTSSSSVDKADPWRQLDEGVHLLERSIAFTTERGRRYGVTVRRTPEAGESWDLWCGYRRVASGTTRTELLAALEARVSTRRRS